MDQFRRRCEGGKKHFAIALAKAAKERRAAQFAKIAEGKKTELDSNRYAHKLSGGGGRKSAVERGQTVLLAKIGPQQKINEKSTLFWKYQHFINVK